MFITMDHGADRETRGMQRVGVPLGSVGNGSCRAPTHRDIHQETTGNHIGKCGISPHL